MSIKDKHPTWFKMKIERRQLIKQLPPETAVNVLLACWDYLETCEIPDDLQPMEKLLFLPFPQYGGSVAAIRAAGNRKKRQIDRYRMISTDTERDRRTRSRYGDYNAEHQ